MVDAPMKHAGEQKLPPPPAPTSRDANPWSMPGAKPPRRIPGLRIDPAKLPERLKVPPPQPVDAAAQVQPAHRPCLLQEGDIQIAPGGEMIAPQGYIGGEAANITTKTTRFRKSLDINVTSWFILVSCSL